MGPDSAVAEVRRAVRLALAARPAPRLGRPVLVALSGGADSVALAAATAFVADRDSLVAGAVIVDHSLQDSSAAVAARAAALADELGLDPVHVVRVTVRSDAGAGGPEAAARTARYAALDALADQLDADILLGHTRDDQAETVLLGLGRGSGPRSIAGMRRSDGRYLRPFLDVSRATTQRTCVALGLPVWNDPHNVDPSFRRVRLRHEVLPLLENVLGGGVAAALARTADLLRADLDALDQLAAERAAEQAAVRASEAAPTGAGALVVTELQTQPAALRSRVLRGWATGGGAGPLTAVHIRALEELTTGRDGRQAHLPGGYVAVRRSGRLSLFRIGSDDSTANTGTANTGTANTGTADTGTANTTGARHAAPHDSTAHPDAGSATATGRT